MSRFLEATSSPPSSFCRLNSSRRPSFLTTYSTGASTRSYVVNRLLQLRHSRRRRTASPVSESLESTTFESDAPQKGHFKVQAVQAAEGKEPPSIATQRTAVR